MKNKTQTVEEMAMKFHEIYERLAPSFGYETRKDTKNFDPESPNGRLMIAVISEVMGKQRTQKTDLDKLLGNYAMGNGVSLKEVKEYIAENYTPNSQIQQSNEKYLDEFEGYLFNQIGFSFNDLNYEMGRDIIENFKKEQREHDEPDKSI